MSCSDGGSEQKFPPSNPPPPVPSRLVDRKSQRKEKREKRFRPPLLKHIVKYKIKVLMPCSVKIKCKKYQNINFL